MKEVLECIRNRDYDGITTIRDRTENDVWHPIVKVAARWTSELQDNDGLLKLFEETYVKEQPDRAAAQARERSLSRDRYRLEAGESNMAASSRGPPNARGFGSRSVTEERTPTAEHPKVALLSQTTEPRPPSILQVAIPSIEELLGYAANEQTPRKLTAENISYRDAGKSTDVLATRGPRHAGSTPNLPQAYFTRPEFSTTSQAPRPGRNTPAPMPVKRDVEQDTGTPIIRQGEEVSFYSRKRQGVVRSTKGLADPEEERKRKR